MFMCLSPWSFEIAGPGLTAGRLCGRCGVNGWFSAFGVLVHPRPHVCDGSMNISFY